MISYSKRSLYKLICSDGERIYHNKHTLVQNYKLIEDHIAEYPHATRCVLNIPSTSVKLLLYFIETLIPPSTDQDWIALFEAMEYLQLKPKLGKEIYGYANGYLMSRKIPIYTSIESKDYIAKLKDNSYLTIEEAKVKAEMEAMQGAWSTYWYTV